MSFCIEGVSLLENQALLINSFNDFFESDCTLLKKFSGFTGSFGFAIISNNVKILLTDNRYLLQAKQQCRDFIIDSYSVENLLKYTDGFSVLKVFKGCFSKNFCLIDKIIEIDNPFSFDVFPEFDHSFDSHDIIIEIKSSLNPDAALFVNDISLIARMFGIRSKHPKHNRCANVYAFIVSDDFFIGNFEKGLDFLLKKNIKHCFCSENISIYHNKCLSLGFNLDLYDFSKIIYSLSIKSDYQINNIKLAHIYDAVCLVKLKMFFNQNTGDIKESDIANQLEQIRKSNPLYICPSFSTISGANENSAIIHYNHKINDRFVSDNDVYLIDSGSQFTCGTTDVTRVFFNKNNADLSIKNTYTAVLKSHIAGAVFKYKKDSLFNEVSDVCNQVLISSDFDRCPHSIGHGVGFCLNVHEGPFNVSDKCELRIVDNIVFSIEPGVYIENKYGIRIENLYHSANGKFNYLTLFPFEKNLINKNLLNEDEIAWIGNYYFDIKNTLKPFLSNHEYEFLVSELNI